MVTPLVATYRLQLSAGFGFADAAALADYLAALGASHAYSSPYLQAAPGSTHGYDVVDPARVNEELGGEEGHRRFCDELDRHGLGQVLDIVPNHMAIAAENRWWWDLLENGPESAYAEYFDVAWSFPVTRAPNRLLIPVLGKRYGRALDEGEIRLERDGADFSVRYMEHGFPLRPLSISRLLTRAAEARPTAELSSLAERFEKSASALEAKDRLHDLLRDDAEIAATVDARLREVNEDPAVLDEILESQFYRLAFWRTAGSELDYRRFFDINTLVGVRMDRESVFQDTHVRIVDWLSRGVLDGVRVDHPDGLRDPEGYLQRLREVSGEGWIVVEKILEPGERLPETWAVAGTTGYDFLNRVNGLFVDPSGEGPLTDLYVELTGESADFETWKREKKRLVLQEGLASDVKRLAELLPPIAKGHRRSRDFTKDELEKVLREVVVCFPVYRSYVRAEAGQVSAQDREHVSEAVERAKSVRPDLDAEVFDFLRDILLLELKGELESELVMRFQQLTGPAMAKGVEDTAFYGFNRFVSLNEVGGDPGRFGVSPEEFHRAAAETAEKWPLAMLATSTHDTKRSEDVRARLDLLSEIPLPWAEAVRRWTARNERHRRDGWPDPNTEYLFYQTLVGAWPLDVDRALAYMEKAAREGKAHTSWTSQNPEYEEALAGFVRAALGDSGFTDDVRSFVEPLVAPGRLNSLSQTLVKLTAPGVPDLYRGTELWDLSLVDPDNRRPVDYEVRRRLLSEIEPLSSEEILERSDSGAPKLWLIRRALAFRRSRPELFGPGSTYERIPAEGLRAEHAFAFARSGAAVTVVPRLVLGLGDDWGDTTVDLPEGRFRNELTGETHAGARAPVAALLARFPVALLSRET